MDDHGPGERWETPVSDARSLAIVSLLDQEGLHITVEEYPGRRRFRFSFERVPAYRNILEEYRTSDCPPIRRAGWTLIDPVSDWLKDLRDREPFLDHFIPGCRHYIIATEDDVIDVLSPEAPRIVEIAPAGIPEVPGQSAGRSASRIESSPIEARIRSTSKDHVVRRGGGSRLVGAGILFCAGCGAALGVATDHVLVGVAIGLGVGLAISGWRSRAREKNGG